MSSTNRGGVREISDYYVTPQNEILKFLYAWDNNEWLRRHRVLDPCAGGDATHPMSYPKALLSQNIGITTMDIREDSPAQIHADFLKTDCFGIYDCIITNPPFSHALEIAEKAIREVNIGGYVVLLLRINFLGSRKRLGFWNENPPDTLIIHSKRISFTDDGKTDSIEYMHVIWQKGKKNQLVKMFFV